MGAPNWVGWQHHVLTPHRHFLTSQGPDPSTQGPPGHTSPCCFPSLTAPFHSVSGRQLPVRRVRGAGKRPQGADLPRVHREPVRVWHQACGGWSPHGVPEQGPMPLVLPAVSRDIQPWHPCRASSAGGDQSRPHLWAGAQQPDPEGKRPGTGGSGWHQQQQRALQTTWGRHRLSWAPGYNMERKNIFVNYSRHLICLDLHICMLNPVSAFTSFMVMTLESLLSICTGLWATKAGRKEGDGAASQSWSPKQCSESLRMGWTWEEVQQYHPFLLAWQVDQLS